MRYLKLGILREEIENNTKKHCYIAIRIHNGPTPSTLPSLQTTLSQQAYGRVKEKKRKSQRKEAEEIKGMAPLLGVSIASKCLQSRSETAWGWGWCHMDLQSLSDNKKLSMECYSLFHIIQNHTYKMNLLCSKLFNSKQSKGCTFHIVHSQTVEHML